MKQILLLLLGMCLTYNINAQFGTAHDFTVTDINGNEHKLYDILDSGKLVVVDVSATWCGPCWSVHQAHYLKDLYEKYGPMGTNQIEIIFYEGDAATGEADLYGTGSSTLGDWVTGVPYPIINESPLTLNLNLYAPLGFPTISMIRPSDREITHDMWDFNLAEMEATVEETLLAEGLSSAEEVLLSQGVSVFPNPASDILTVSTDQNVDKYEVINMLGQAVKVTNNKSNVINVSNLTPGQYTLRMYTNDGLILNKPFVKG